MIPCRAVHCLDTNDRVYISTDTCQWNGDASLFEVFQTRIASQKWTREASDADASQIESINLELRDDIGAKEAYRLNIRKDSITIQAMDQQGWIWGLTTLFQLLLEGKGSCSCQVIEEHPKMSYRGFHLDCSRHFFDDSVVKKMIEQASLVKLNVMHWHISDDQGYRLESKAFPKLNKIGSWRKDQDGSIYGGYYSWEQVKQIIAYAAVRGIEIVPEIDMPGHVSAILAAYPELSCSQEPMEVPFMFGIHKRVFCGGNEETMAFIKKLLDEIIPLFPSKLFHIGGDEVPKDEWKSCEKCQKKMKLLQLKDEEALQAHFSSEIADYLIAHGKTPICWNEALRAKNLHSDVVIQYWNEEGEDRGYCAKHLDSGRRWIYSYSPNFYFDYIPALAPMRKVLASEPRLRTGEMIPESDQMGVECALWSETILDAESLYAMAFPRMYAVAEIGWNGWLGQDEARIHQFAQECKAYIDQVAYMGLSLISWEDSNPVGEAQKQAVLQQWKPRIEMAKKSGMTQFIPVVLQLVQNKLEGAMDEAEIQGLLQDLQA